jgi:hypothetical protein
MPSTDSRFHNATGDIGQHMLANDDWDIEYLYENILELYNISDESFMKFLEEIVHPRVRSRRQTEYVEIINTYLKNDSFKLEIGGYISGYPYFTGVKLVDGGVRGTFKNLIFAADGPKPDIIISDSINNDIKIVNNQEYCLVYDKPISSELSWDTLVEWWADKTGKEKNLFTERDLYARLVKSLDKGPETNFFKYYFGSI